MTYKLNPFTGKLDTSDGPQGPAGVVSAAGPGSQGTPSISFAADLDTGLYNYTPNGIAVSTAGTGRLFIDASGRVGVGTTSPARQLTVYNSSTPIIQLVNSTTGQTANDGVMLYESGSDFVVENQEAGEIKIYNNGSQRATIDSSGRLLVGTSSARSNFDSTWGNFTPSAQFETNNNLVNGLSVVKNSTSGYPAELSLAATKDAAIGGNSIVGSGQRIGQISFKGADGTNLVEAAEIRAEVDGTPGANDMPGRLVFSTTSVGNSAPNPRMTIKNDGKVGLGTSSPSSIFHAYGSVNNSVARIENVDASTGYGLFVKAGGTTSGRYVASFQDAAGNTRLHILSSGNVGIGTTSPSTPLHIETATAETEIRLTTTGGNIRLRGFNDDLILNADQHRFNNEDNTTEYARIDNSGRLLVGTSTDVAGGNLMQISAAGGPRLGLNLQDGTVASGQFISAIDFYTLAGFVNEKAASIECYADAAQGSGDKPGRLVFSTTADGASSPTERMRIDSAGNVGIGTESPTFSNGSGLEIEQDGVSTLRLQDSSGLGAVVEIFADDGARSAIYDSRGNSSNHGHEFRINGSPKLNIDSSGRLLVGTTSTANRGDAKHIVQGDVSFGNGGGKAHTIYKETAGLADAGTFDVDLISNTGATCGFGTVFYRQGTNQQVQTFSFAGRQSGVVVQLQDTSVRGSGVSGVTVTFAEVSSAGKIRITNGSGTVLDSVQVTLFLHSTLL
jgi:hypothetical protein